MKNSFLVNRLDAYANILEKKGNAELARKLDVMGDFLDKNPKVSAVVDNLIKIAVNNQMGKIKQQVESDESYMKGFGEVEAIQYDSDEKAYMAGDMETSMRHNNRVVIDRKEGNIEPKRASSKK